MNKDFLGKEEIIIKTIDEKERKVKVFHCWLFWYFSLRKNMMLVTYFHELIQLYWRVKCNLTLTCIKDTYLSLTLDDISKMCVKLLKILGALSLVC